ncbi:sensor histidine kinase [Plantactinospora solaniradicis]|uniref:histidine kinase n=1 Tax=Plantactinospora solaniradicis TaxID=1723736 RepID=A0ABW1KQY3_9ACTN
MAIGPAFVRMLRAAVSRHAGVQILYVVVGAPLAVIGFVGVLALLAVGGLLSVTLVGVPVVAIGLVWARGVCSTRRWLARVLLDVRIDALPPAPGHGIVGWVVATVRDGANWRAAVMAVAHFPFAVMAFAVSAVCWGYGVLLTTYPVWWWSAPVQITSGVSADTWPRALGVAGVGVSLLMAAPWVVRSVVNVDLWFLRTLVASGATARRLRELEHTRAQAVDEAATMLRRIERDLHDGAQARLVAVAIRLGMVKDSLAQAEGPTDLAPVRTLVDRAHHDAKATLAELRDLVRGIHPPILDSGLEAALASLTAGSTVPTRVHVDIVERPSPAVETLMYFCTAELLTNVAKHSQARQATVHLTRHDNRLQLRVSDNGVGGATPHTGTGLAGLAERLRPIDGRLQIRSPLGGPTVVSVEVPG